MRATDYPYFDSRFLALAHRGGAAYEPNIGIENTLTAFQNAVDLGFRYLETDVHASSDGELFAFHDDVLDRVTDGSGLVAQHTASELREVRVGGREPIPTMSELFEALPHACFNIDLKSDRAAQPLADVIEAHVAHERVCVASFHPPTLRAFRKVAGSRVATSAHPRDVMYSAYTPVLPHLFRTPSVAYQVPITEIVSGKSVRVLTPALIRHAHATGKQVHVWTIDDATTMHRLIDMGVDGIVTDRPDILKHVLIDRDLWSPA